MRLRRALGFFAAIAVCMIALPLPSCRSFEDAPADGGVLTPDGTAQDAAGADAPTGDAPLEGDASSTACATTCSAPGCVRELFDGTLSIGWIFRNDDSSAVLTVKDGDFEADTRPARSNLCYLERDATGKKGLVVRIRIDVLVDFVPSDGATLAKIVDQSGRELSIRVDGGKVHACGTVPGGPPEVCTPTSIALSNGTRASFVLEASAAPTAPTFGTLTLRTDCVASTATTTPFFFADNASLSVHVGLEGEGAVRYDLAEVSPGE